MVISRISTKRLICVTPVQWLVRLQQLREALRLKLTHRDSGPHCAWPSHTDPGPHCAWFFGLTLSNRDTDLHWAWPSHTGTLAHTAPDPYTHRDIYPHCARPSHTVTLALKCLTTPAIRVVRLEQAQGIYFIKWHSIPDVCFPFRASCDTRGHLIGRTSVVWSYQEWESRKYVWPGIRVANKSSQFYQSTIGMRRPAVERNTSQFAS